VNNMFNIISLPAGMVFISYFFNVHLKASAVEFAIPQAFTWVGMIAVALVASQVMKRNTLPRLICRSLLAMSVLTLAGTPIVLGVKSGWLASGQVSIIWTGINFLMGCSANMFIVPLYTFFQEQSADKFRGRFWGIENSLRTLALGCGYLIAGILAQSIDLTILFSAYAVVTAGIAFWARKINIARENLRI
ncbi:MAG TPA: hypothetical protein VHT34_00400, partial [Clostridia bacterium]|nr:hypothetical protein [Clostridia bacterium]